MKKTLFLLLVFCAALMANAQAQNDEPTAILQHGDQSTVFTGTNAFVEAESEAQHGDVITLSAGTFNAPGGIKTISVYGAGFEQDETTGTAKTVINGTLTIVDVSGIVVEGLYIQGDILTTNNRNITISKCWVEGSIRPSGIYESQINQCVIGGGILGSYHATNLRVSNTSLAWCYGFSSQNSVYFDHCLVRGRFLEGSNAYNENIYTNCIFSSTGTSEHYYTGNGALMINCIYTLESNIHSGAILTNCYQVDLADIFADGENAAYSVERTYELQQPNLWVGTDGTPIGPSGGMGWMKAPSTPVVRDLQLNLEGTTLNINYEAMPR